MTGQATPVGDLIRSAMAALGVTRVELGRRAGITESTMNMMARGQTAMTAANAIRLELVTGIPAHEWTAAHAYHQDTLARPTIVCQGRPAVIAPRMSHPTTYLRLLTILEWLPELVEQTRQAHGHTRRDVVALTEIPETTLRNFLERKRTVDSDAVIKLVRYVMERSGDGEP